MERGRARGAAILLSSHSFEEVGHACNRVSFIRAGRVPMTCAMDKMRSMRGFSYSGEFRLHRPGRGRPSPDGAGKASRPLRGKRAP